MTEQPSPTPTPRQRVLAAAGEIFARSGYAGARIDDIASRAGVNKAMVYYHVGDKSAIYATVLGDRADTLHTLLNSAIATASSPEEKLRAAIGAIARAAKTNPHFAPIMLREIASGGAGLPPEALRKAVAVFGVFQKILEEGRRAGVFRTIDPLPTHMMIAGIVLLLTAGAPLRARLLAMGGVPTASPPEHGPQDLATSVYDLVINGLRVSDADDALPLLRNS